MILLIDALDGFTYNLVQAFQALGEQVEVARFDQITLEDVRARNRIDRAVAGAGANSRCLTSTLPCARK